MKRRPFARAHEILAYCGIAGGTANELARKWLMAISGAGDCRALATEPQLLALDEPAAGNERTETATLSRLLERIRRDGVTQF